MLVKVVKAFGFFAVVVGGGGGVVNATTEPQLV